jgi:hypothetical protein
MREIYRAPELTVLGSVAELTLAIQNGTHTDFCQAQGQGTPTISHGDIAKPSTPGLTCTFS